jgi:Cft2 family RNA processing exonuclease
MIEYDQGIHLRGTDLWFDSRKKAKLSFISNANIGRFVPPEKVIATPETIRLIEKRIKKSVSLACPYNRPFTLGNAQVELIPSGYMLGAAQIEVKKTDKTIIYTGDINLRESITSKPARVKRCQILVLKCTYASPKYIFPPVDDITESLIEFIEDTLSSGSVPMVLAEALGKAQDIIKLLSDRGYKLSVHKSIYKTLKIYEEFGIKFPNYDIFKPKKTEGRVLVFPPLKGVKDIDKIRDKRVGIVMESAPEEISYLKKVFNADEVFPLGNHASFDELLQFVEFVRPERVYLIHGHPVEFAHALQKRGFEAAPLEKPSQLKLL